MTTRLLDSFTSAALDEAKWQPLQVPTGDGQFWRYEDPDAQVRTGQGELEIRLPRFQLQHEHISMLDNPKHLLALQEPVDLATDRITSIACEMACENHNGCPDDLFDGFAALSLCDPASGLIFDFVLSETCVAVIHERLPLPGVTPPGEDWLHVIQSPLLTRNARGEFHHYEIRFDHRARRCEWLADGKRIYQAKLPAHVRSLIVAAGLFTLKPQVAGRGSVSNRGQGATGRWRGLTVSTP
ncbi:hypothetical protein D3C85_388240 [compost metagenome]